MVIFGRSNLAQHAPISHVNFLVCRNLLIYFDSDLQKQILNRLHYALEPGGFLFMGKSESQLTSSRQFQRANARWRVFQRITAVPLTDERNEAREVGDLPASQRGQELEILRQQHRYLLETLRIGVFVLDSDDVILQHNTSAMTLCGFPPANLVGERLADTDVFLRIPNLGLTSMPRG